MGTIIAIALKYLPYLVEASNSVPQIVSFISEMRQVFQRTKVWTPEQEKEFEEQTAHMRQDPAWQTDAQRGKTGGV